MDGFPRLKLERRHQGRGVEGWVNIGHSVLHAGTIERGL